MRGPLVAAACGVGWAVFWQALLALEAFDVFIAQCKRVRWLYLGLAWCFFKYLAPRFVLDGGVLGSPDPVAPSDAKGERKTKSPALSARRRALLLALAVVVFPLHLAIGVKVCRPLFRPNAAVCP